VDCWDGQVTEGILAVALRYQLRVQAPVSTSLHFKHFSNSPWLPVSETKLYIYLSLCKYLDFKIRNQEGWIESKNCLDFVLKVLYLLCGALYSNVFSRDLQSRISHFKMLLIWVLCLLSSALAS